MAEQYFPNDPLLGRFFLTPEQKKNREEGRKILKHFYTVQTSGDSSLNFFRQRNLRWTELLLWAKGSQPMQEFLNYMNVSPGGGKAWVNLDYTQTRIAPKFVGTLVESMAKNRLYPCVDAIDDGSINEKQDRLYDALFRMHDTQTIDQLQQATGMVLEDPTAYVPDDEMSAKVYFELEDRLPKEIRFEKMLQFLMNEIAFEEMMNRQTLYDQVVLNFAATKIEKCGYKQYTVRKCIANNMVYNFFIDPNGKCGITQIGEFYNEKVKDFRRKYGKSEQNPDGLTEKEIFELAKLSTNKSIGTFNYMWNEQWATTTYYQNRPYDDSSILVLDAEINFGEDAYYVEKKDPYGRTNIIAKKGVPYQQTKSDGTVIQQEKPEDVNIIKRTKNTWMRGVYAPYGDKMLYWGAPDIIITPYTDVAKPLSSYTVNIPNNDGEYVPSLFERGMETLREYQITKLKRKQIIAKLKPTGIRIDIASARNLDLGSGDSIEWEEVMRIYDQTGNEIYSSEGVDPLRKETPPLSNTVMDRDIEKVIGLTNVLLGQVAELRELWGVPVYRDGSDVGDRTAAKLAEGQNQSAYNVTDFVLNANNQLWQETFYKVCLLHWNDIVREEPESQNDMINTRFSLKLKMKITEYQKQLLEADIQRFSQMPDASGNPLISPKDALMLREIDNYKLAAWYLATTVEQNRRKAIEDSLRLQKQNGEEQRLSEQQSSDNLMKLEDRKLQAQKELEEFKAIQEIKKQIVVGSFQVASKGENPQMPAWLTPILMQMIPNLTIPMAVQNENMQEQIAEQEEAEQEEMMMQQQLAQMSPEQQQQVLAQMQGQQQMM